MRRPSSVLAAIVIAVGIVGAGTVADARGIVEPPGVIADRAGSGAAQGGFSGPDASTCPATLRGAVIDRAAQRAWLCEVGVIVRVMPITSARDQPDPGVYDIYAEDLQTTSYFGPRPSVLDLFVAFTRGKHEGARIGFHGIPRYSDGTLAQPPESVGTPERFGDSSGCIRLRPEDALFLWEFLTVGHQVHVIS